MIGYSQQSMELLLEFYTCFRIIVLQNCGFLNFEILVVFLHIWMILFL